MERRSKQVEALRAKLATDVLNEAARTQLQGEFERAVVEFQRFSQDTQAEVPELQEQMQISFGKRLPVIGQIPKEKDLWAVFSGDRPILWHDPKLHLAGETIAPVSPRDRRRADYPTLKKSG